MKKPANEFSRPIEITKVGQSLKLTATEVERQAVARRLGLVALDELTAELQMKRGQGDTIIVKGQLAAKVTQSCVVTLEPVTSALQEDVVATYSDGAPAGLDEFDPDDASDAPEPVENGKIDLGELVVQHLSLALDPYPRKAGAEFKGYGDAV
jgi:uncharacterized metal-binding protein YceD (DUF177 family)